MKKSLFSILVILLCAIFFVSCSAANDVSHSNNTEDEESQAITESSSDSNTDLNPNDPVDITLWHYYTGESQALLENLITEFNQTKGLEEGIIVNPIAVGTIAELEDAVTESAKGVINSEPMPDIFSCYADKALELSSLDVLCDLNNYFSDSEKSEYIPQFLADGIINNALYVIPIVKSTEVFYINNTELNSISVNAKESYTWTEIYDIAKKYYNSTDDLSSGDQWDGKSFMGFDSVANYIIVSSKQAGIDIIDGANNCVNIDKEVLKPIFDNYYLGMSLGYYGEVGKFRSDDVKTGDLVAYTGASSGAGYFPEWEERDGEKVDIELTVANYPSFTADSLYTIQQGAGMAVAKGEASKEQASAIFLKWFTDTDQNIQFATETGYLPVKTDAYEQSAIDEILNSMDNDNIKKVYEIAVKQVIDNSTYAPVPFDGSYNVRQLLQTSLKDIAAAGISIAQDLKLQNADEQSIIEALDSENKFNEWIDGLISELEDMGIEYKLS